VRARDAAPEQWIDAREVDQVERERGAAVGHLVDERRPLGVARLPSSFENAERADGKQLGAYVVRTDFV
jgi:hypothetical protein